jgi:hypothetical protein
VRAFAKDLSEFATASASIQFPLDKPLPLPLIRKITAFRVRESIEEDDFEGRTLVGETNPANYRLFVSGYLDEIDRMRLEVGECLQFLPAELLENIVAVQQ